MKPANTLANIDIIFQKIVFNLIECIGYIEYTKTKKEFENIFVKVKEWIIDYVNNGEHVCIEKLL